MLQRKQNKQGASRKPEKKKANYRALFSFGFLNKLPLKPLLILLAVLGNATVLYSAVFSVDQMLDVPVHHVEVKGQLKYQDKKVIQQLVNDFVSEGYIRSDLSDLRSELLALPWIEKAVIKRKLNNALEVNLQENTPVAYWNDDELINDQIERFKPKKMPEITGLPKFSGRDHLQVIELYRQLSDNFSAYQQLQIAAIALDSTKAVRVVFSNGIMVTLNQEDIEPQLDNLEAILKTGLANRLDDVATIDLRYNNGAAVAWRKNTIAYNQSYAGADK